MVNNPHSVPPPGQGPEKPDQTNAPDKTAKNTGSFAFQKSHTFLGMHFTAKQWNQLMNNMMKDMSTHMNQVFQKMKAKLKKDWERGSGDY